ncbi:unnamed protein product, partial [Rotaria sp. Silwood1]
SLLNQIIGIYSNIKWSIDLTKIYRSFLYSLVIDCCYSILQDELFLKYFHDKISIVFPYLEKLTLVAYQHEQLVAAFLNTLHNLNYLVEIRLYSLFSYSKN